MSFENHVARQDHRYRGPTEGRDAKRTDSSLAQLRRPCYKNARLETTKYSFLWRTSREKALPRWLEEIQQIHISSLAEEFQHWTHVVRKPTFCICENKDVDQLRGNREADQRLCFRYIHSTIPLLSNSEISSL